MDSTKRSGALPSLLLAAALSLTACASPPPALTPPVVSAKPKPTPLPVEIKQIDTKPSASFFERLDAFLSELQSFQQKLESYLASEKPKSAP